jgi:hypothetical protein
MNRVWITWEIDCVHSVIWVMAFQPFHSTPVRGQPMLTEEILTNAKYISGVKKRFVLSGDEI